MTDLFLKIYDFLHTRRRLCMTLMAVLTGLLIAMVSSLKYNENILDFLPMNEDDQKALTLYQDITGGQRVVAMFKMQNGDSTAIDKLSEAVDTFTTKIQSSPGKKHVSNVTSQVDFEKITGITDFIYQNIPLMLHESDYDRMEQILSNPDSINAQLANDVQLMMMPATGFFTSNISNDPLGLFNSVMSRLQAKQATVPFEIDNGYIYTPGHKYALAMLNSPYGAMETANNALLVSFVDSICQETMKAVPGVNVETTGSPVIAVGNSSQIKTDSIWAISISVTLIIILLMFSFHNLKNITLIGISILFGWLFAMGFTAVLRSNVSLIVLAIGSIIIGIAVNYPLHFIAHKDHGGTIRDILKEMIPPLLVGNVTTVGAFAALIPLEAPALRDLGLFAVFMLIGTILFTLIFLPHITRQRAQTGEEHLSFGKLSSMEPERHNWLMWIIVVLTFVFGYFSLFTSFDANMHHINYMTPSQTQLLSDLQASAGFNDTANVYVVSEGKTWDEALVNRSKMAPQLAKMQSEKQINSYSDVTTFICDKAEQQKRIDRWNKFWATHRQQALNAIHQYAPEYGFSDDAFAPFADILNASYSTHPFEYFEPVRTVLLSNSFSGKDGHYSVVDRIDAKGKNLANIEAQLNDAAAEQGYAFDFMGMNSSVARSLSDNFNYIGFACGFIVFFFLWMSYGRLELSLLSFLPMAMGWLWILGIMYLFDMQFNIVNVILATFIFGQGDDYTIFITDGLINEYAYRKKLMKSYKNSIIISALILFIGMGSLIVAKHPALHSLAEVTIVGMFTVVLMAWIVPPMIFGWMIKTNGKYRRVPVTLEQLCRTGLSTVIYLLELAFGCVLGFCLKIIPVNSRSKEDLFHRLTHKFMRFNTNHIFGVESYISNPHNEKFERGSMLISNHQSMLDPIWMLALDPHVLILISGKVWKNPIVHTLFKLIGFINLDQPIEKLSADIKKAVEKGYNVVIFPEGKRTNGEICRFHRGAFQIAQEIGADILPVYLHGTGHVMSKGSGMSTRGQIHIEIGKRVANNELANYGNTPMEIASYFHHEYENHFEEIKREIETTHYFHHYIIYKYIYKNPSFEKESRRLLKKYDDFSKWIDGYQSSKGTVSVLNAGRGQFSLLFALVHPEIEVHSYATDEDDAQLLACMEPMPANLHVHDAVDEKSAMEAAKDTDVFNSSEIIANND